MRSKKLIASLLSAILLLSAFPLTTFAEELPQEQQQQEQQMAQVPQVPQIHIVTENGNGTALEKEDGYVQAKLTINDPDGTVLEDDVSFKVRGNTTALYWVKKKAFTFKFAKKKELYGMGKGKKWVLLANAFDPTLMRNYLAFDTARELGFDYVPGQKVTELWLDGVFRGCYTLMTPVQEGKDRVNINIENGKDFMVELESLTEEDDVTYFKTEGWRYAVKEPEEPDEEEAAYIQNTFTSIAKTLKSGTEQEIRDVIDVESFAKFYVLNEYMKTFDFSMSSVFFYSCTRDRRGITISRQETPTRIFPQEEKAPMKPRDCSATTKICISSSASTSGSTPSASRSMKRTENGSIISAWTVVILIPSAQPMPM